MEYFTEQHAIVRKIWGSADTVLFIFAGAAAEFALNKAVDWLYFTGKLPADPIGRLFSTVGYARQIIFAEKEKAYAAIDKMSKIHSAVESSRGMHIPDYAYRDVLFMLIYYSIAAFEMLERKLTRQEKEEVTAVFCAVGHRMKIPGLPAGYEEWKLMHSRHLEDDLHRSHYTVDLYKQYKRSLGKARYLVLLEVQKRLVPPRVKALLQLNGVSFLSPALVLYKICRTLKVEWLLKSLLLPRAYIKQIKALEYKTSASET
ncbi:oxygenase MpaB family protein [Agriterribacter sp.]|uniref:oxygenase MpaB family protein n=1 Tax=Agriterribacter sp. TaxID=2821509 RepID=UPI002CBFC5CF|nr:oxygenase MpaB family protein [Agriterribacter sp.]HRO45780.1 oxygenase MpaB family protein [Agriterribacter sp.]HRQ16765.1 oxygenase MpaB family protein [Agriterribacter sp.]